MRTGGIEEFETLDFDSKRHNNLGYFSHDAAQAHPDNVAIYDLSLEPAREVTYAEIEERLNRVASLLTAHGLEPGDRVAICVGNRFEFVEIMYGMMRAGIVPVPLNTKLSADVIEYTLTDAGCRGAVVDPATNKFILKVVETLELSLRIAFDAQQDGWLDYETRAHGRFGRVRPARHRRRSSVVPALYIGLHGQAEGGCR